MLPVFQQQLFMQQQQQQQQQQHQQQQILNQLRAQQHQKQFLLNQLIQQQQKQQLEEHLSLLLNNNFNFNTNGSHFRGPNSERPNPPIYKSNTNRSNTSSNNLGLNNTFSSAFQSSNLNSFQTSTSSTISTSNSNSKIFDSFEEKLAMTGNIFKKREDWSVIAKLPINKQNTMHIRLDDEGPYGNDETRCFVLSHFSSLGVKNVTCLCCSCELDIYDRFPLVDGTLFLSPVDYDKAKSIPSAVTNKKQYVYAVCLKCLTNSFSSPNSPSANGCCGSDHEVVCKFCSKSWQKTGGSSLQIGTLYKYDIFASFPCCASRLTCSNSKCNKPIMDVETAGSQYFSSFSEEKECPSCKVKAYHFIKPLREIFLKSQCESRKESSSDSDTATMTVAPKC
jgi:hypothetical protein